MIGPALPHTRRVPIDDSRWLWSVLPAIPLGVLATATAVLGAAIDPVLPLLVVGCGAIFTIGFARPLWIVYMAVLALPFEFQLYSFAFFDITPTKGLLLLGAAGWVTSQVIHRRTLIADTPLTVPLLLLIAVILPGLIVAENKIVTFTHLAIWVALFCLYQAIVQTATETFVRRLLTILAIVGVGLGMLAITDTNFQGGTGVLDRADGGFGSPNGLAALLLTTIPPAICMAFAGLRWKRAGFAVAAAVGIYGMLLTQSRGGFLSLAAGLLVLTTWRPLRRAAIVGAIVLAGLAFGGINPVGTFFDQTGLDERISSIATTAPKSDPRVMVYRRTVTVIRDHPIFGVGTNDYRSAAVEYGIGTGAAEGHAHNAPLTITAERGLLGLGAFIIFGIAFARLMRRALSQAVSGERRAMLMGIMAVFLAVAVHNLFDYTLGSSVLLGELFALAGCVVVLSRLPAPEAAPPVATSHQ